MCTVSPQTFQAFNSPKEVWTSSRFYDQVPQTPQDRHFHLRCLAAASPGMVEPMAATHGQYSPRHSQWAFIGMDDDDFDTSNLHTRVIQSPLKEILLSTYRPPERFGPDSPLEATSLLADLGRLAPSLMKDFTPKHHAQSSFVFRLINDIDFRGEEDGYIAMSYCWKNVSRGPSKKTVTPLGELPWAWTKEVEQFLLPTSAAVFQAVLRERKMGEGLWFDQVCINQEDEREKVAAMGAMDSIYKNARTVVIALDDVTVPPEEEQFLQPYIDQYALADWPLEQQPNTGASPPFMQQYPLLKSFIERILCSVWFERAWCAQEMKMGRSHVFILPCGSDYSGEEEGEQTVLRFDGNFFYHILSLANEVHFPTPTLHVRIRSLLKFFRERLSQYNNSNLAVRNIRSPISPIGEKSITPIIAEVFQLEASGDPRLPEYLRRLDANRDRMCITLNAAGLPLALTASNPFSRPNIEAECIRSLLLVGLAARDPVALCTTGPPLQLHDGSVSWLCRPSSLDVNPNRPTPPKFHHNASHITQGSDGRAEFAQLDLIFLDLPHRTRPNPQYSQLVARARVFIDLCVQCQLDGSALWNFWQAPNNPRALAMRNIFIQTLACLFDLGPNWCLEVSLQIQQSNTPALDPQVIDMLLNPHLLIHNYLQLPEGQAAMSQLLTFVSSIIASGMPWSSGATERSYGPLIISAPNSTPNATLVSRAIIFAPFEHSKTLLIATPAAIKDMGYGSLARGWVLTSMNPYTGGAKPTVSWTLQAKGVIFGDGNFNATLASCGDADVRNHRVYGPSNVR